MGEYSSELQCYSNSNLGHASVAPQVGELTYLAVVKKIARVYMQSYNPRDLELSFLRLLGSRLRNTNRDNGGERLISAISVLFL